MQRSAGPKKKQHEILLHVYMSVGMMVRAARPPPQKKYANDDGSNLDSFLVALNTSKGCCDEHVHIVDGRKDLFTVRKALAEV